MASTEPIEASGKTETRSAAACAIWPWIAKTCYANGVLWMNQHARNDEELARFREQAQRMISGAGEP